jgi:uncharacterized protein (DUF433 family)
MGETIPRKQVSARHDQTRKEQPQKEMDDTAVEERLLDRIVVNPKVMVGKPVIKGTRVPVEHILNLEAHGLSHDDILKEYPHLTRDDIMAALLYAAKVMGREEVYPVTE